MLKGFETFRSKHLYIHSCLKVVLVVGLSLGSKGGCCTIRKHIVTKVWIIMVVNNLTKIEMKLIRQNVFVDKCQSCMCNVRGS
jgi:hypothetical protein